MQHDPNTEPMGDPSPDTRLHGEALARRQLLLKGLSKGTAGAAVLALPVVASAAPQILHLKTTDNTLCTVSGQQSAVTSRVAFNGASLCKGFAPSYFFNAADGKAAHWPTSGLPNNNPKFSDLFPGSTSPYAAEKVLYILVNRTASVEAYWIAAWFNALHTANADAGYTFPYGVSEVQKAYAGADASKYLSFFIKYLSSAA